MVDSYCETLWENNSFSGLGIHHTAHYDAAKNDAKRQSIISQQGLRSNIIILCIINSLNKYVKYKLRAYKTSYAYNRQGDGSVLFFVLVIMVRPDTRAGFSGIKVKLETMNIYHFNNGIHK